MIATTVKLPDSMFTGTFSPHPQNLVAHWYVVQTCAHHEKRVSEQLGRRAIENFLPLYQSVSQWKDRRVCLQLPLFVGYVFVRLSLRERPRVLEVPGVVRLVGFGGTPASLPDEEINGIRNSLKLRARAEPYPYLVIGDRVRIDRGPLQGVEGILVRRKNCLRLVLSVDLIQRSIAVEIDAADVSAIPAVRASVAT